MTDTKPTLATIRTDLAAVPATPWRWLSAEHEGETSLMAGDVPLITTDHEHDPDGCDVDVLFHEVRDGRSMYSGTELADAAGGINNAVARFTERAPAYVAALLAALDRVGAVADALTAEADLDEVGGDEYVTLHTAAARIRGAIGAEL